MISVNSFPLTFTCIIILVNQWSWLNANWEREAKRFSQIELLNTIICNVKFITNYKWRGKKFKLKKLCINSDNDDIKIINYHPHRPHSLMQQYSKVLLALETCIHIGRIGKQKNFLSKRKKSTERSVLFCTFGKRLIGPRLGFL